MRLIVDKIIETSRLYIRKLSLSDAEQLKTVLGDAEVMRYSLKGALDESGIKDYINKILSHYELYGYGLWGLVLKETREIVGIAGLISQSIEDTPYIELAYRLAKKYWGRGFATEAAQAIKEFAFNKLNIKKLISIIEPKNISSIKVARRIGMKKAKSAKFYEFNVVIYEIKN